MSIANDFTAEDVAQALRTMTPAQRRTVKAGRLDRQPGYWPLLHALYDKGLMTSANRLPVLTPFGKAVQAALKADA